ncbi:MAG: response regulator [Phycisphaerales bacterium]|nr:response regulator [Phycisphaerales bacterium]
MERQHSESDHHPAANEAQHESLWPMEDPAQAYVDSPPLVLVVTSDMAAATTIDRSLTGSGHRIEHVTTVDAARARMMSDDIDLLLVDIAMCDDDLTLIEETRSRHAWRRVVVWGPSIDSEMTIQAIRCGACDVLQLPRHLDELNNRIQGAVTRARTDRYRDERIERLVEACEELRISKDEMSDQVDVLCGDLASAWSNIKDQMSIVETTTEFRTLISQELDVEQMLRTSLEYLLEKIGPTNGVIYLREAEGEYGIGAYVNYEWQDRNIVPTLEELGRTVCPQMLRDPGLLKFDDASEFAQCDSVDSSLFESSEIVACSCPRDEDCLAVMVLFRRDSSPYTESMACILDALRGVLAEQLGRILRVHKRSAQEWPEEVADDDADWGDLAA